MSRRTEETAKGVQLESCTPCFLHVLQFRLQECGCQTRRGTAEPRGLTSKTLPAPELSFRGAKRRGNLAGHGRITGYSRQKRNCLPEIATAPLGPRNDKSRVFTVLTIACTNRKRYAGSGCPLPYRVHALNRSIRRSSAVTRRQFPWAAARSAPSPFCRPRPNRSTPCPKSPRHCFGPVYLRP